MRADEENCAARRGAAACLARVLSEHVDDRLELVGHVELVRVVLNKADAVPAQNLMRVYGALMWMLGGVVASPEVPRVYIGSFWDKPFINAEMAELMEMEEGDLIEDLATLPQNNVMSKINEVCRRCRQVETHVHILACLRARVAGTMFGRAKLQQQLLTEQGMASVFNEVRRKHDLSKGDFPDWQFMARQLQGYDFTEFYKPSKERSQKLKKVCLLYTSPSPRDGLLSRMPSSA